jgi:hypothetical protein
MQTRHILRLPYLADVVARPRKGGDFAHFFDARSVDLPIEEVDIQDAPVALKWPGTDGRTCSTRWHDGSHWTSFGNLHEAPVGSRWTNGAPYHSPAMVSAEWIAAIHPGVPAKWRQC